MPQNDDPEIKAMQDVTAALSSLDGEATARVIRWVAERKGVSVAPTRVIGSVARRSLEAAEAGGDDVDLARIFERAHPKTEGDRVLLTAYWFTEVKGQQDLDGQSMNTELKHLGEVVSNITRAVDGLKNQKPALMQQVRKSGTSKQARKTYRLTTAGMKAAELLQVEAED